MRFFNTFIRITLPAKMQRKNRVFSLLYSICFAGVMLTTLYLNSVPQAVLALLGITFLTSYYTKKLTSPAHFLPTMGQATVMIYDFDNKQQTLTAPVVLDRKKASFTIEPTSKQQIADAFLQKNEADNDFYRLMLQAKAQYSVLYKAYEQTPSLALGEALGLVTMLHSHFIHGAEFTERALALPNSFPRKPTASHTYTLQLIRIALNRMEEAIEAIATAEQALQFEKANQKMRETLRFVQM